MFGACHELVTGIYVLCISSFAAAAAVLEAFSFITPLKVVLFPIQYHEVSRSPFRDWRIFRRVSDTANVQEDRGILL